MRYTQVKNLKTLDAFREHVDGLDIALPIADRVEPNGVLSTPISFVDASAGTLTAPNRFAILPMEGWDGSLDGGITDLVRRRWGRFAASGAGLVWAEATAVRHDGRANPNQLVMSDATVDDFAALRRGFAEDQIVGLQLTHSGRYCRPVAAPIPRTAYEHPRLDGPSGADASSVLSDDELDGLVGDFLTAAHLARQAGFDFVDVKACHGYLGHELLSAHDRPGKYGGDLMGRTLFLRNIVEGIRRELPDLAVALRLSIFDLMPFTPGEGHVGRPVDSDGSYPYAFGGDGTGLGVDLTETHTLMQMAADLGIGLVCTTAGSPYYVPHVQRPAFFPPSDGYKPPEDPLVGVARQVAATAELAHAHPEIVFVGSGYSYLQQWLPEVAEAVVGADDVAMVGLGRMVLSYPDMPADVLAGRELQTRLLCRTFSDCTTAPRAGLVSGCFPIDPFYKEHPQRVELAAVKRELRTR